MSKQDKKYWLTLEELNNDPGVSKLREEEFFEKPEKVFTPDYGPQNFNRRDFMKLGGAAMVFSMIACGKRPEEKIIPYVDQPEEITIGIPNFYASACNECSTGCGVVVKTREGRPIKMEGNPEHPVNKGKLCARGQASLLNLYDPDRLRHPVKISEDGKQADISFKDADREIADKLKSIDGEVVILSRVWHGPARAQLIEDFAKGFRKFRHIKYEALFDDSYFDSIRTAFEKEVLPEYHIDKANILVLFGADLFASGRDRIGYMSGFGSQRVPDDNQMSKVYAFEPAMSEMGACADERYLVKTSQLYKVAYALLNHFLVKERKTKYAGMNDLVNEFRDYDPRKIEKELHLEEGVIGTLAKELWDNRRNALLISESYANKSKNSQKLHLAVHLLNTIFQESGSETISYDFSEASKYSGFEEISKLVRDMKNGNVSAVIIAGPNPVYCLPEDFGFAEALKKVPLRISLSDRIDETAKQCEYILPSLHGAESWADFESKPGVYSISQPTISPLWDNRQVENTLMSIGYQSGIKEFGNEESPKTFYEYLKDYWEKEIYKKNRIRGDFKSFWIDTLQKGFFETGSRADSYADRIEFKGDAFKKISGIDSNIGSDELRLIVSSLHLDGRSMNNAWLLETPDPISRITWDNYLSMAPSRAEDMNLREGDVVKLSANGRLVEIPVHIAPAHHKEVMTVMVGWGRTAVGNVGNNIGVNAFALAKFKDGKIYTSFEDVSIEKTGKNIPLACVQGHHYIQGRPILQETTLEEFKYDPHAGDHGHEISKGTLWREDHSYPGHKWGMAIDLNSCIGCNACMTACQVENNIPVVGKQEVLFGREMHWIRIDRYFEGEKDNPDVVRQPMLCHHCDKAPCETVCPVLATVHNDEGLNLQIYNRCVGTRYCSNNCPYKVRRFNYYDFYKHAYGEKPLEMLLNPEVTVRTRGVMEKCTFCIQRIRDAKHAAKKKGVPISEGEVRTACQQTCPTNAIVFGDLNDPESAVSKAFKNPRAYTVLKELNIKPNIAYLTLVRNKKPDLKVKDEHGSH